MSGAQKYIVVLLQANGRVQNTGHGISYNLELGINDMVNISGGPVSYNYPIYNLAIHFGQRDDKGSEHTIDGSYLVGEVLFTTMTIEQ
jgi:hypothetical protein